ncbi:MAG TPA: molybdopterin cofactor-binding domain-containing protein, partial [Pseudolabrys sp.]
VDIDTGRTTITRYLVAEDAGRIINPMIADGQVHGGVAQGIGNALYEEIIYDENGTPLTATLADYMTPTAHEIPTIELHHKETPSTESITKAKGLGEGGGIGAPAAVINAINDALAPFDVVIDEMPATPQRVRAALRLSSPSPLPSPLPPRALARGGEGSGVGGGNLPGGER